DNEQLYKPREDRAVVMDKVLEDFKFAAENVRADVEAPGLEVNRAVVLAFMSRVFLFEGTWQKYHEQDNSKAATYLEAAKWATDQFISSGENDNSNFVKVINSIIIADNAEVILYIEDEEGILSHALNSYNNM